ncbi:MAG: hypothetical protein LBT79_07430 [Elusimicrobiota bacterium]|jgi:uncharacterized protein YjgD (DUF1641 family)|nr:hypothetical protein [Elusimicrobiota bacterium]
MNVKQETLEEAQKRKEAMAKLYELGQSENGKLLLDVLDEIIKITLNRLLFSDNLTDKQIGEHLVQARTYKRVMLMLISKPNEEEKK